MNRHNARPWWATWSLRRPVRPQRDLPQLLERLSITIHKSMGLDLLRMLRAAAVDLTGMLNRQKQCSLLLIQADTGDLTFHRTSGKAGSRFFKAIVTGHEPAAVVAEQIT